MKFNRNKLICTIVVIAIIWVANILYYKSKELGKPIFFRHMVEERLDFQLNLSYVEDKNSKDEIHYVKIPELGDEQIYVRDFFGRGRNSIYSDKHYNYCVLHLPLNEYFFTYDEKTQKNISKIKGDRFFTKITYVTTSGKEYTEDVGKIHIRNYSRDGAANFVKQDGSSTSSTVNEKFSVVANQYSVDEGVKFTGYNGYFKKEIEDIYDIEVNGVKLQDIKLPMDIDKSFYIESSVKKDLDKNQDIADFYIAVLDLSFENSKGEKMTLPFEVVSKRYIMNYGEVKKEDLENLIKIRRGE